MTSTRGRLVNEWTFLGIALLAAWFPICRPYLRMGDDFHFADWFSTGGIGLYLREDGVWRVVGHGIGHMAALASPLLPGALAIATHCIAAMLFLAALRQLLASEFLALLLALVFAVYPWGDTALLWVSAYTYLIGTMFSLAVLCLLLRVFPLKNSVAVPLCLLCATLSLFSHEASFFPLLISGGFVLLSEDGSPLKQRLSLAAAPAIACGAWAVLYKMFPGRNPTEHIKLNPRTLLSGVYYQYTNLQVFVPWKSRDTRDLIFFGWSPWLFAAAAVLVCMVALCAWGVPGPARTKPRTAFPRDRMLIFLAALLVAAIAIYAIGGGFSLDSRRKYPTMPFLLMFLGYGIERFFPRLPGRPRQCGGAILAVAMLGIATTWLQIGLWRHEAVRLDLLVDFLRTQPDPTHVRVDWDSRVQAGWPGANQHWGAPVESWVLADALTVKAMTSSGPIHYAPPVEAVKFDDGRFEWEPAQ